MSITPHSQKNEAKIKAIISDLGGVLVNVDKENMCAKFAEYSPLSKDEIAIHFSSAKLTAYDLDFGKGLITPRQFYESMCRKLSLSGMSFEEFSRIYSNVFSRKEAVIKLLRLLGKKYVIALLSNTDALHYGAWSRLLGKDMKLFKKVILSFQVHAAKPNKEIFLAATEKLKLKPQQCVYIDDIMAYSDAATNVGMHGIRFVSAQQLQQNLSRIGVRA